MHTIRKCQILKTISCIILFSLLAIKVFGQRNYPPVIESGQEQVYKQVGDLELKLWIFNPPKHSADRKVPAIVFFFGGGWNGGSPEQFVKHCEYLAARGMVTMVADYRVKSRNGVLAKSCVEDAKSAVRWIREHASELGIDPDRIAAGGGSAGGHLAAATGTLSKFDAPDENMEISSKPNAMVLFNPVLVLASLGNESPERKEKLDRLVNRLGAEPKDMSPYHNVTPGIVPTIIFHGTKDKTVPFESAQVFTDAMKKAGNLCKLAAYENEGHGFFNYGRKRNGPFISTVAEMDAFLVDMGWLNALQEPMPTNK